IFLAIKEEDLPLELKEYLDDDDEKVIIYNPVDTLIKFYQDNQYDKIVYWKEWFKLIQHYKSKRQYRLAYECIQICLKLVTKCNIYISRSGLCFRYSSVFRFIILDKRLCFI